MASLLVASIWLAALGRGPELLDVFRETARPILDGAQASIVAVFVSDAGVNTFPRLAVRDDRHALVWLRRHADVDAHAAHQARLAERGWHAVDAALKRLDATVETLRLAPTSRSRLR